jgi:biotin--protein ligase
VRIKWPNDLYAGGLKLGGVLCHSVFRSRRFATVTGVGLNLDNAEPTTCVNALLAARHAELGLPGAPAPLAREVLPGVAALLFNQNPRQYV